MNSRAQHCRSFSSSRDSTSKQLKKQKDIFGYPSKFLFKLGRSAVFRRYFDHPIAESRPFDMRLSHLLVWWLLVSAGCFRHGAIALEHGEAARALVLHGLCAIACFLVQYQQNLLRRHELHSRRHRGRGRGRGRGQGHQNRKRQKTPEFYWAEDGFTGNKAKRIRDPNNAAPWERFNVEPHLLSGTKKKDFRSTFRLHHDTFWEIYQHAKGRFPDSNNNASGNNRGSPLPLALKVIIYPCVLLPCHVGFD